MKRPYLNEEQRELIKLDIFAGAMLNVDLASKKMLKTIYDNNGWFEMKRAEHDLLFILGAGVGLKPDHSISVRFVLAIDKVKELIHDGLGYIFRWLTK
tara:strand:+ start:299 stop:592 length:294 start_codon:yes stop_codon:yes gene_type:complete